MSVCAYSAEVETCRPEGGLADSSGVALSTVADFEIDKREPRSDNLTAIRRALEDAGVEFIPAKGGKGVGVRLLHD